MKIWEKEDRRTEQGDDTQELGGGDGKRETGKWRTNVKILQEQVLLCFQECVYASGSERLSVMKEDERTKWDMARQKMGDS